MTLTELRYIVTLSQEQHFGRAAERCFVSQPTLSIAVKKLEDELGVPLFERSKGAVRVTPVGDKVVRQAQRVLEQAETIKDLAQEGKDQLSAPLRVGAIYTVGPYLFPHLIPQLQRLAPQMPLYIEENFTETLRAKLRNGDLDAIIIALPFQEPDVLTRPVYDEPFLMLLPKGHSWAEKSQIDANSLADTELLLLGEGHCFRDQVLEACPTLGSHPGHGDNQHTVTEGSSLETIRMMVASGLGSSVLPLSAANNQHYRSEMVVTRPFKAPQPMRTVAVAWRASYPRPQAIDMLVQAISRCQLLDNGVSE
ncbi:hydrogen peroxide-inducible genes activator [Marinobacterium arenosum]|uniref:hydrogen peroxide-inducible genes activator n=1 Tax=Marinobacterium arenosum TaxID=2862496 RepID=UPI001C94D83C|nr:hydrogen peroxide-inducible genes activator [Marinobacterium arenosum]MBY4678641.1 LysR family transcriptional regulator [Marinobacterium arenosum]